MPQPRDHSLAWCRHTPAQAHSGRTATPPPHVTGPGTGCHPSARLPSTTTSANCISPGLYSFTIHCKIISRYYVQPIYSPKKLCTIQHISTQALVPGTLSWRGPMPIHGRQQLPFPRRGGQALGATPVPNHAGQTTSALQPSAYPQVRHMWPQHPSL